MATKKSRGEKGNSGEGKAAKASGEAKPSKKRGSDPSVTTFLKKLGGAPSSKGRATPAKGLLGDMRREDLVEAGRLSGSSDALDLSGLDTARTTVHVEVSSPGTKSKGRIADRTPFHAQVEVRSVFSPTSRPLRSVNLSVGGVFVETTEILELGDPVMLSFATDDGGTLSVNGRVRWVTPFGGVDDAVPGMGISFVGLDETKRVRLERMLRKMPRTIAERAREDER